MNGKELLQRRRRIGLPVKALAALAGVDQHVVTRLQRGTSDPRRSTVERVTQALEQHERQVLRELIVLHPDLVEQRRAAE